MRWILSASIIEMAVWGGGAVWIALTDDERNRVVPAVAAGDFLVRDLRNLIGAEGWRQTPEAARSTLLAALDDAPLDAAVGGGAVWETLDEGERMRIASAAAQTGFSASIQEMLLRACATKPDDAARVILALDAVLDAQQRAHLLRLARAGRPMSLAVARAMRNGCAWRDRMIACLPDEGDAAVRV